MVFAQKVDGIVRTVPNNESHLCVVACLQLCHPQLLSYAVYQLQQIVCF